MSALIQNHNQKHILTHDLAVVWFSYDTVSHIFVDQLSNINTVFLLFVFVLFCFFRTWELKCDFSEGGESLFLPYPYLLLKPSKYKCYPVQIPSRLWESHKIWYFLRQEDSLDLKMVLHWKMWMCPLETI